MHVSLGANYHIKYHGPRPSIPGARDLLLNGRHPPFLPVMQQLCGQVKYVQVYGFPQLSNVTRRGLNGGFFSSESAFIEKHVFFFETDVYKTRLSREKLRKVMRRLTLGCQVEI